MKKVIPSLMLASVMLASACYANTQADFDKTVEMQQQDAGNVQEQPQTSAAQPDFDKTVLMQQRDAVNVPELPQTSEDGAALEAHFPSHDTKR